MERYLITNITEADYGCEEPAADGAHAYLYLRKIDSKTNVNNENEDNQNNENQNPLDIKRMEVSENSISKMKLDTGRMVGINDAGELIKIVRVVAAVIVAKDEDGNDIIFATERGYGEFKGMWEFPGGKIETGETPRKALAREIKEELDVDIEVGDYIDTLEYDYPEFHLSMDCFYCNVKCGEIVLKEASAARWLRSFELRDVNWLPADVTLIEKLNKKFF